MLKLGALGLEHGVLVVCTLPPSTTGVGSLGHGLCTETVMGEKGIVLELCARFGIAHGQLDPMDGSRMFPVCSRTSLMKQQFPLSVSMSTVFWPFGHPLCSTAVLPAI